MQLSRLAAVACWLLAAGAAAGATGPFDAWRDGDYLRGKQVFQGRCSACHTLADSSGDIAGPNLWGLFGRRAGSRPGFRYSAALSAADFRWTPERLGDWLRDPAGYLPGNIMGIPEPVPDAVIPDLVHFLLIETGAVDWQRPAAALAEPDRSAPPAERFPSFWNHLMHNTVRYRWEEPQAGEDFQFEVYFKPDGSAATDQPRMFGFWHITERDFFCYALTGMPVGTGSMVECFPVAAMAIPRFAPELWVSKPQDGVRLHGGILPGRPDWVARGGRPPAAGGSDRP